MGEVRWGAIVHSLWIMVWGANHQPLNYLLFNHYPSSVLHIYIIHNPSSVFHITPFLHFPFFSSGALLVTLPNGYHNIKIENTPC